MFSVLSDFKPLSYDFAGVHRGVVVNNDDPLKAGRVKIKVFPMFIGVSDNDLPWAILCDPLGGGFANTGSLFVPEVGSHVWVMFENMDHRFPVYIGGAPAIDGGVADIPTGGGTYPHNRVIRSKTGNIVELDDSPGSESIRITHEISGSKIEIDVSGKITITATGGQDITVTGDLGITVSGNATVNTGGNVDVTVGGNTTITGTGPVQVTAPTILLN